MAHTRAEEASADQSALRYMVSAGIDPEAMLEVLDLFRGQEALSVGRQDPYVRSHPLTRDRYRTVQAFLATRGDRRGAIGRQRILVRKAQRQAFGLPAPIPRGRCAAWTETIQARSRR